MSATSKFLEDLRVIFKDHDEKMWNFHKTFFQDYHELLERVNKKSVAKKMIPIKEGQVYSEDFFTVHCIEPNTEDCLIETDAGSTVFPAGSFFKGAIYPINIRSVKKSGGKGNGASSVSTKVSYWFCPRTKKYSSFIPSPTT